MLELVLSFHHTGHEYEIWVMSLESKHLYTLICRTDLTHGFLMDCSVFTLDLSLSLFSAQTQTLLKTKYI